MKFEIKHRWNGNVLFSLEAKSLKLCVEAAVESKANLAWADLAWANLDGANLDGANLAWADLVGANLVGANLVGADLAGAKLAGAKLAGVKGLNKHLVTPITILADQPGKIRAYKLVNENGEGPYNGGIKYEVGKSYSVDDANTDDTVQCAAGINLATLDWCLKEWYEGYRILIAEFTAKDIAAIPVASDGKFRVHRCKIVGEKDLKAIGWPPEKPEEKEDGDPANA